MNRYCVWSRLAIFFAACACFFVLRPLLLDPDYYWHLETGRLIFEQWALPSSDVFAYTNPERPWVLHEWLFQLLLFAIYDRFGDLGIRMLCTAVATATLGVVYSTALKLSGRHSAAAVITSLTLILLTPFILPRPQIFSFLFFAVFLRVVLAAKYFDDRRSFYWLPVLMAAWVNLHGGYGIGLVLLFMFAALEWFRAWEKRQIAGKWRYLRQISLLALLSLLASFINPDGPAHLLYPLDIVSMAATAVIFEWQPPTPHAYVGKPYFMIVGMFILLLVYRRAKPGVTEMGLSAAMIAAGMLSIRHVPFAALTMAAMTSRAVLTDINADGRIGAFAQRMLSRLTSAQRGARELGRAEVFLNVGICAAILAGTAIYSPTAKAREADALARWLPVNAVEFIRENEIKGRMFNSLHFGGYLIHRLYPQMRVFIDGRTDYYGDRFFTEYLNLNFGSDGWEDILQKYKIEMVISEPQAPLRNMLLLRGDFALVYQDESSSVLLKREEKYQDVIRRNGH